KRSPAEVFAYASIPTDLAGRKCHVISELEPNLDPSLSRRFGTVADGSSVKRTVAALEANGIIVLRAPDAPAAKRIVLDLIPDGSLVHHGASQTLDVVGITDEIDKCGRYEPLRPRIWSMDRKTQADEIRRLGAAPDVMLGSVHAVTETGSLLAASMSGSQLGPYVSRAGRGNLDVGCRDHRGQPRPGVGHHRPHPGTAGAAELRDPGTQRAQSGILASNKRSVRGQRGVLRS